VLGRNLDGGHETRVLGRREVRTKARVGGYWPRRTEATSPQAQGPTALAFSSTFLSVGKKGPVGQKDQNREGKRARAKTTNECGLGLSRVTPEPLNSTKHQWL
jgi:hypothetical protein